MYLCNFKKYPEQHVQSPWGHLIRSMKVKIRPLPCEMAPVICVLRKWQVSSQKMIIENCLSESAIIINCPSSRQLVLWPRLSTTSSSFLNLQQEGNNYTGKTMLSTFVPLATLHQQCFGRLKIYCLSILGQTLPKHLCCPNYIIMTSFITRYRNI